jgi:uncharacterized protein (TIGR02594 family)
MDIVRTFFAVLFSILKAGPAHQAPGVPTPGPLPQDVPTPIGKPANLPPLGDKILKRGMPINGLVVALQKRLIEIGYQDLNPDGDFGEVTQTAVRQFQLHRNLDPDGEVGTNTWTQLARADAGQVLPPLLPPSTAKYGAAPDWYNFAAADIGFHEKGNNQGLDHLIAEAGGIGSNGDPWCAIFVNAKVHKAGFATSGNALARSFESSKNFIKLDGPALGAITTMWRDSPSAGIGHVFLYDGEGPNGIRGIGGNETDQVKRSFHERRRVVGYYWPKGAPLPARIGPIAVNGVTDPVNTKET